MRRNDKDWPRITLALSPSDAEARSMLRDLVLLFGRSGLGSVLGVSPRAIRAWLRGYRRPAAPARRLLWLVWHLIERPGRLGTAFDLMTWGRFLPP